MLTPCFGWSDYSIFFFIEVYVSVGWTGVAEE